MKSLDQLNFAKQVHLIYSETPYLSCELTKFNDEGKRQKRAMVISDQALYNFKGSNLRRRIPLDRIDAITTSSTSYEFIIHVHNEYDYRYISFEMRELIVKTLLDIIFNVRRLCQNFNIY